MRTLSFIRLAIPRCFIFAVAALVVFGHVYSAAAGDRPANLVAKLSFTSSGCFHLEHSVLSIYRDGSRVLATLEQRDGLTQVQLSHEQIQAAAAFFVELKAFKNTSGCTTVNTYTAELPGESIRRTDGGCSWNGFFALRKALFNQ